MGVGLGIAAVLKVAPVLLLVYLLIRGRRQRGVGGVVTTAAGLARGRRAWSGGPG